MDDSKVISGGKLKQYIFGLTTTEETAQIERLAEQHPELRQQIDDLHNALNDYANKLGIPPARLDRPRNSQAFEILDNEMIPGRNEISTVDGSRWRRYLLIGAACIAVLAGLLLYWRSTDGEAEELLVEAPTQRDSESAYPPPTNKKEVRKQVWLDSFLLEAEQQPISVEAAEVICYIHEKKSKLLLNILEIPELNPASEVYALWGAAPSQAKPDFLGTLAAPQKDRIQLFDLPHGRISQMMITRQPSHAPASFTAGTVVISGEW